MIFTASKNRSPVRSLPPRRNRSPPPRFFLLHFHLRPINLKLVSTDFEIDLSVLSRESREREREREREKKKKRKGSREIEVVRKIQKSIERLVLRSTSFEPIESMFLFLSSVACCFFRRTSEKREAISTQILPAFAEAIGWREPTIGIVETSAHPLSSQADHRLKRER